MEKTKNNRIIRFVILLFVLTLLAAAMIPVSAASAETSEITSITLNKKGTDITINVSLEKNYAKEHKNETLYVFELSPWQSTSELSTLEPVAKAKASETMKITLPYINGNANRLYSKFLVAEQSADGSYVIVTSAKYIENLTKLAENTEAYPASKSKKGLQAQMIPDLQLLGVRHALVTVAINEYIVGENIDGTASFVYNGQTYYINRAKLDNLDYKIKSLTDSGMNVYMNFVLSKPDENASSVVKSFYYDGISDTARSFALNTRNETAMKNFQAFMDYMASRYTRADHAYGFVPNFIIGFEINSGRNWHNAGASSLQSSVYAYHTAFRVAYTAMSSHYSEGRVFISLGNNFNSASATPGGEVDPSVDWSSKEYLDFFASVVRNSGDIPWGLSIDPYPSDKSLTEFWLDDYATTSDTTPFITMKNIDVLTKYMHSDSMTYNGAVRDIIIGEFGVSGDPSSNDSQSMQAAAFALAYYTAAQNEDIDAFIWHRHVDHSGESFYYGLWSSENGNVQFPLAKKTIYTVFSQIDTEKSADVTSFVKTLVGSGAYSLFIDDSLKFDKFNVRTVIDAIRAEESEFAKGFGERMMFDLTQGSICKFFPTDNFKYVELSPYDSSTTMLYARSTGIPTEYAGIGTVITEAGMLTDAQFLTLSMMVEAPADVAGVNVMLRLEKNGDAETNAVVFDGEVLVKPNELTDISFKIKDFVAKTGGEVDTLKLWIKTPDANSPDGDYGIWLKSVLLHTKASVSVFGVIVKILVVLIVLAVAGYAFLYFRAQKIRRARRAERERRMREQLRERAIRQNRGMNPPPYSNPAQNQWNQTSQWNNQQDQTSQWSNQQNQWNNQNSQWNNQDPNNR